MERQGQMRWERQANENRWEIHTWEREIYGKKTGSCVYQKFIVLQDGTVVPVLKHITVYLSDIMITFQATWTKKKNLNFTYKYTDNHHNNTGGTIQNQMMDQNS